MRRGPYPKLIAELGNPGELKLEPTDRTQLRTSFIKMLGPARAGEHLVHAVIGDEAMSFELVLLVAPEESGSRILVSALALVRRCPTSISSFPVFVLNERPGCSDIWGMSQRCFLVSVIALAATAVPSFVAAAAVDPLLVVVETAPGRRCRRRRGAASHHRGAGNTGDRAA